MLNSQKAKKTWQILKNHLTSKLVSDIIELTIKLGKILGGVDMKKEEILKKAQEEKTDEMETAVRDRSAVWMAIAMTIAAGFFICMREEGAPIMDLTATVCFSTAVCCIYRFFRLKKVWHLVNGLMFMALAIFATVRFFQGH